MCPLGLAGDYCDFLLAGTHKWLGAYQPMGLGFFGHPRSSGYIHDSLLRWTNQGEIDDALLSFGRELQSGKSHPFGETVAVFSHARRKRGSRRCIGCECKWRGRRNSTQSTPVRRDSDSPRLETRNHPPQRSLAGFRFSSHHESGTARKPRTACVEGSW